MPGSVRSGGRRAAITPVFVHRQPDGLRLPVTPYSAVGTCRIFDHARGQPPGVARARGLPRGVEVVVLPVESAASRAISAFPAIGEFLEGMNPTS